MLSTSSNVRRSYEPEQGGGGDSRLIGLNQSGLGELREEFNRRIANKVLFPEIDTTIIERALSYNLLTQESARELLQLSQRNPLKLFDIYETLSLVIDRTEHRLDLLEEAAKHTDPRVVAALGNAKSVCVWSQGCAAEVFEELRETLSTLNREMEASKKFELMVPLLRERLSGEEFATLQHLEIKERLASAEIVARGVKTLAEFEALAQKHGGDEGLRAVVRETAKKISDCFGIYCLADFGRYEKQLDKMLAKREPNTVAQWGVFLDNFFTIEDMEKTLYQEARSTDFSW